MLLPHQKDSQGAQRFVLRVTRGIYVCFYICVVYVCEACWWLYACDCCLKKEEEEKKSKYVSHIK
jgi:hypothetical protein